MELIVIIAAVVENPLLKLAPKVPTITPFCLIPKIFPLQPSPHESVILIVRFIALDGVGVGVGVGVGGGVGVGLTYITSTQVLRLQSLLLLIYPKPLFPQLVPQEFLIIHWVAV